MHKPYQVVHEDSDVLVVNKKAGVLTIPSPKGETNTLTDILNYDFDQNGVKIYPCHRLDRETSGLIIYAKGKSNQQRIMKQFHEQRIKKTYLAFVQGSLKQKEGVLKGYFKPRYSHQKELMITHFRVIKQYPDFCFIKAHPLTGRTNQIRIQFKAIGHPVVGENVYAFRKDFWLKFKRTALHSAKLIFTHPRTQKQLVFEVQLPPDMQEFLEKHA